ncbi:hypothetical protein [Rhodococcus kronopolitis]|uniref:Lipoprotein n=1 Tax=Rhodococcus kronopolitis TaxID=1460226 RepID=A0ABV9FMI9_9NOCA
MSLRRFTVVTAGALAALALTAGCAADTTPTAPTGGGTALPGTTAPPAPPVPAPGVGADTGGVTADQAARLCADMQAQLQSWRTYTPTIGKGGLNTVVGTWAAQSGVNMLDLIAHKSRVDAITEQYCPEVRQGAIKALEIPDLAAGLIGF